MRELKTIAYSRPVLECAKLNGHVIFGGAWRSADFESVNISRRYIVSNTVENLVEDMFRTAWHRIKRIARHPLGCVV